MPLFPLDTARGETTQRDPQFLPDGRHFLYSSAAKPSTAVLAALDGSRRVLMEQSNSPACYAPSSSGQEFLLFIRSGQLMAQQFEPGTGALIGEATPVAEGLGVGPAFSASQNGVVVFRPARGSDGQLSWFERDGKPLGTIGDPGRVGSPRISPDQKTIAFHRLEGVSAGIWLFDTARGNATRLTLENEYGYGPLWTPDGANLIYYSRRGSERRLVERSASGVGQERVIDRTPAGASPSSISKDGRLLVYADSQALFLLPFARDVSAFRDPIPFPRPASDDRDGSISPDGHWFLYSSTLSGRRDVFVRSMPDSAVTGRWQISLEGGAQPVWRADGKELFFVAADGKMMSVPVESGPAMFRPGVPKPLFQTRLTHDVRTAYDVTADGKRFIVANPLADAGSVPMTVILNWPELLKK